MPAATVTLPIQTSDWNADLVNLEAELPPDCAAALSPDTVICVVFVTAVTI